MSTVIGPFTLTGTTLQNNKIAAMAQTMSAQLKLEDGSYRVRPIEVAFVANDQMPWATEPNPDTGTKGVRARGFWRDAPHRILMNANTGAYPVGTTFAHEVMHAVDDDWLMPTQRREIRALMVPPAAGWQGEVYAVYASAAVGGFSNPPYTKFYDSHTIPADRWPKLKAVTLRDDHGPTLEELVARVAILEAQVVTLTSELDVARAALADCESRVVVKDTKMQEGLAV